MDARGYGSIFVSHGSPMLAVEAGPARDFLIRLGQELPRPRAVIVASPHWQARGFAVKQAERFRAWHDFYGFPSELYRLSYAPPGDPQLAAQIEQHLRAQGLPTHGVSGDPRIDHGVWIPLMLMYPQADVPVVQVAISGDGPDAHLKLGRALGAMRLDGVLVLGSGGATHNLGELGHGGAPAQWSARFDDWLAQRLADGDWDALTAYREQAPDAARAHPTEEHLMPLFVAGGAGGRAVELHRSFSYGTLSMAAYGFEAATVQ